MEKLKRLQELTGNEQLAFSQVDLEGEFDPQQHDQLMQVGVNAHSYKNMDTYDTQFNDCAGLNQFFCASWYLRARLIDRWLNPSPKQCPIIAQQS